MRKKDRLSALAATRVLVNSHYSRETFYRTYGAFAHVGRLGVDTEQFRPLSLQKERSAISVGALTHTKGFDLAIQSLGSIKPADRPLLTIISNAVNPPEHAYLQDLAARLAVTVEFRVGVGDDELVQAYNRALLTIYTPVMEPFGFVPLESMSCGVPVVGVNEAGVRETVRHGETGLLVERDADVVAQAIAGLLADDARLERLGRQGRDYVERAWGWDGAVQAIEAHLFKTAKQNR
jgi:glycosyltransferase involved in cell wall biosynthesis